MKTVNPVVRSVTIRVVAVLSLTLGVLLGSASAAARPSAAPSPKAQPSPGQSSTATTTAINASPTTITLGGTVTFTATVTAATGTPTGLVTFFDGSTPLGSGTLTLVAGNSQASFSTSLLSAAGSPHSITAVYQGDATHTGSTSSATSETVNARTSTTGIVVNPTTVVVGQSSTATVTVTDSGSVPPGTADTFTATGAPATGRTGFTSTLFADGLVLVAGGTDRNNIVLQSAEIYNVSGATFSATGNLNASRAGAVAVLLPTGMVLVAGGSSSGTANGALNTAELFDPSVGTFTATGNNMTAARFGATATLLNTGKILIAGGENSGGVLNSAELYDPVANTFTATGNLNAARTGAAATLLGTGKALIAGGSSDGTANGALNTAELFDPAGNSGAGTFTAITGANSTLSALRWQPEAALLLSGKALIAGGQNSGGALSNADLYDPVANTFTASNHSMGQARANGSAVALPNGMVLLAGGTTSQAVDLYDADSDKFDTTGSLQQSDSGLVSTLLNNGRVLVVGLTTAATPTSDAELYSPSFNPLGTVAVSSSEATDSITGSCVLTPSTSTASTCTSTVIPVNVATSPHTITGTYPADAVHSGSSNTASLTVNKADTTTTVTSSANPSVFGQSVTITATVSPVAPGAGTPTGTVTFLDGGSPIGTGTLSSGIATFTTSALAVGNHTIVTSYGGNGNFNGSTGSLNGNPQVVNKADTATTVTSSANPSVFGQSVTFTATVSPVAPGSGTPTGTVTFLDGGSPVGSGTLSGGVATFTTSALAIGNHTIVTNYGGDGNFNGSTGSLTGNPQVVNKANTATTVTSSVNPSVFGQSVTFTATVSAVAPGAGTPTGTVTFLDGGSPIGTGTLSGGIATFTTSALAVGNHTVTTSYGGSANFNGSTGSLTGNPQVVTKTDTTTTVTSSQNPSALGQSVTFTATVSPVAPGSGTPTGTVTFLDGGSPVGTGTLSGGIATFTTSALALGNHTITTSYGGDGNFNGSTGSLTGNPQVVGKANSTTTLTSSHNPATVGQSITVTATVAAAPPAGGTPTGTVTFLDGGTAIGTGTLSAGVATFTTSSLAVGNHTITSTYPGDSNFNGNTGSLTGNPQVVLAAPPISKAFAPTQIAPNGVSALTVTITNPAGNTVALTGVAFTDTFPANLVVATPNGLTNTCGGTATATAGSGSLALSSGTVPVSSSCTVTVNVTSSISATYVNTTGAVSSTNGGTGGTASATLVVATPPAIAKAFGASTIPLNGTVSLTFTITNPPANTISLTGVAFTDSLPSGLQVASPNGLTGSCGSGTITAAPGASSVSLSGATLPALGSCTIGVNVTGASAGVKANSVTVTSGNAGTGNTANASVTVMAPPTLQKAFGAPSINLSASTSLTFTASNPNTANSLTSVAFTDTLPAGLVVATPNGLSGTCGGGTITAAAGSGSVALSGATLAASASCSFSVNVTGVAGGTQNNTTSTIASAEGGSGPAASASVNVLVADLTIVKAHTGNFKQGQTGATYTITVSNQGAAPTVGGISVTDTLPSSLTATAISGSGWTCTLATVTCSRSDALAIGASYPAITVTVNVSGTAPTSVTNTAVVSGGGETNTTNDTASDVTGVTVVPPDFSITTAAASDTVKAGQQATFSFSFAPLNNVPVSTPITLTVTGLPSRTSAAFQTSSVTPGSNVTNDTLIITTTNSDPYLAQGFGRKEPPNGRAAFGLVTYSRAGSAFLPLSSLAAFAFLLFGFAQRKRLGRQPRTVWVLVLLACCGIGLYGCASAQNFKNLGTPPGTYTLTVTATLANGNVQHSSTVTLTVLP